MARPKETGLSAAFQEKEAQERERLELRLAKQLKDDMEKLFTEGAHADLTLLHSGISINAHTAIIKQRAPAFYNRHIRGSNPDSIMLDKSVAADAQSFLRSVYSSDKVLTSPWNSADLNPLLLPSPKSPMDTNGNGNGNAADKENLPEDVNGDNNRPESADKQTRSPQGCCVLGTDLLSMYYNKVDTDVVITVQEHRYPAHRAILCARSPYFSAMLGGGWRESSSQEIKLEKVSAGVVEQVLIFMYGGRPELSPTCDLGELVVVSDMYGIVGIKDIAAFILKRDYCHFFHKPCTGCLVGVCESLPLTFTFGLDELLERCLKWSNRHFVRLWPTKPFALLPQEVHDKCCAHLINDISTETVLEVVMDIDRLNGAMPQVRWADSIVTLKSCLMEACIKHIGNNFGELIMTPKFLSLSKTMALGMDMLLDVMRKGVATMPARSACRTYLRCRRLARDADTEECEWSEDFKCLVKALYAACEQYMHQYVHLVVITEDWKILSPTDQATIKEGGFFVVPEEGKKPPYRMNLRNATATRPTGLPSQRRSRGGGNTGAGSRPGSSSKTPSSSTTPQSPRTPQTPSSRKGTAASPKTPGGQTHLTPTTPSTSGTKTLTRKTKTTPPPKTNQQTPAPPKSEKAATASSQRSPSEMESPRSNQNGKPKSTSHCAATESVPPDEASAPNSPAEKKTTGIVTNEPAVAAESPQPGRDEEPAVNGHAVSQQDGACSSQLLKEGSDKSNANNNKSKIPHKGPPAKERPQAKMDYNMAKPSSSSKRPSSGTKALAQRPKSAEFPSTSAKPQRPKSAEFPSTRAKQTPAKSPSVTNGKVKPEKKLPIKKEPHSTSAQSKDSNTSGNLKKVKSPTPNKQKAESLRPSTSHLPRLKAKSPTNLTNNNKDGPRSRTSSASSQPSSPRSAGSASKAPLPHSSSTHHHKTPPRQSGKDTEAIFAKCTTMRIAAMKKQKKFDADIDETESVISTLSHVAVRGSRTPSIADMDLSPSDFPAPECNGDCHPSNDSVDNPGGTPVTHHFEEVPLCPPQDHSDTIVPVFDAVFSQPDATKDR